MRWTIHVTFRGQRIADRKERNEINNYKNIPINNKLEQKDENE